MNSATSESAVRERYSAAAEKSEPALCCPVVYDKKYLEIIPQEVIEKDYGCGDPSQYLHAGEVVLDLGSGTGKICFIAAQVVGPTGRVIGVDMTEDMLEVSRRNAPIVAQRLGFANVEFRRGRIQDLTLDLDALDEALAALPIQGANAYLRAQDIAADLRVKKPLIADNSIDVVVSNCVLNLVDGVAKPALFRELHRVLRKGGRAVISDIVSDEDIPVAMQLDPLLWSGCISGALREDEFLRAFEQAGFYGIRILRRDPQPWQIVEGIEFRSLTIEAFKGKEGPCLDYHQAVIYKGPFREVCDDDGHRFRRGERAAVCEKTYLIYQSEPYRSFFEPIPPRVEVQPETAELFDCRRSQVRHHRESKGLDYRATIEGASSQVSTPCC